MQGFQTADKRTNESEQTNSRTAPLHKSLFKSPLKMAFKFPNCC